MANHENKTPNKLINESSPYLLQHAYNPVQWYPWSSEVLKIAKEQDKPILVSIGYSACHWCHVMEREVFENDEIAVYMNEHFINIKVDREERPDVDQIYMEALQTMNVQGGWPLNVFLTPDAQPFYGGTYFPPEHWTHLLNQISKAFQEHRTDIEKSAAEFTRALNYTEFQKYDLKESASDFSIEDLDLLFNTLQKKFDNRLGGKQGAPKFPMPSIYLYLLRYYHISKNKEALQHLKLTLDKMAMGGIYDQIGGGFARYSVDDEWFAPHFEKMLYDNGQLVSLYSEAYKLTKSKLYKETVYQTIDFLERELVSDEGGIYSALDADSEGIEGKFYVWTYGELKKLLKDDFVPFSEYYGVKEGGNWEHEYNILHRNLSDIAFCNKHGIKENELNEKLNSWTKSLMKVRENRIRPGLDDKILTSWNGLMLQGLVDAYRAFGEERFLILALRNADFITTKLLTQENQLFHSYKNGKASINGFLEDYAFVIPGFISLYQVTFDEAWLHRANAVAQYTIENFWDKNEGLFFFTSAKGEQLIARKKEIFDNVIPASNSAMAHNLFLLGKYFETSSYSDMAAAMLGKIKKLIIAEPSYLSNWASLLTYFTLPFTEVVLSGKDYLNWRKEIDQNYLPNLLFAGTQNKSELALLKDRETMKDTRIFVCQNNTCQLPVNSVAEALKQIRG